LTELDDRGAAAERALVATAGGYLRNVIREPYLTCSVCGTPVDGYARCFRCHLHATTTGTADVVAPLAYGIERAQSGVLLRHYKDDVSSQARAQHGRTVRRLLYLGITLHQKCIEQHVGTRVDLRVTVPSLNHRPGVHPFTAIATAIKAVGDDPLALVPTPGAPRARIVSPHQFELAPTRRLDGQHVMVLDDTWTTGSNAQSAALTLREAGAGHVSVMVIGRWISPSFAANTEFVATSLQRSYDPRTCPVTGGSCP
jgi:hypothetical protein